MIRKLGLGISVLTLLTPGLASALGVGEYQLNSYLNQPLDMEISLTGTGDLSPSDIVVDLASQQEFATAGIRRSGNLSQLDFEITLNDNGTGTIDVTTDKPIDAPYMDFLVKILWPTGRILREYTILLDPPSFSGSTNATVTAASVSNSGVTSLQTPSQPATVSADGNQQVDTTPKKTYIAGNTTSNQPVATSTSGAPAATYTVQSGDTLWGIASQYRPGRDVSVQQVIIAIQNANPNAFYVDGNVNFVKEGAVLRIPNEAAIRQYGTRSAMQSLAQQNERWRDMLEARGIPVPGSEQEITAGSNQVQRNNTSGATQAQGEVKLLTADQQAEDGGDLATGTVQRSGAGSTNQDGSGDVSSLQNKLAIKAETVDRLQQQNKELDSRIGDLKQQINTSDKLLELRNNRIAALQERLRELKKQGADVDPALLKAVATKAEAQKMAEIESAAESKSATNDAATATPGDTNSTKADSTNESAKGEVATNGDNVETVTGEEAPATITAGEVKAAEDASTDSANSDETATTTEETNTANKADTETQAEQKKNSEVVKVEPVTTEKPVEQSQGLVGSIIDFVMGNLLIVGIIILLLILIAVALVLHGRKQEEEEAEFAVADADDDFGDDGFLSNDLSGDSTDDDEASVAAGDAPEEAAEPKQDPLEEVEMYVAYGRFPQAIDFLRHEIDNAPERADLKVKLLEIEKEANDDDAFEKDAAKFAGDSDEVDACIKRLGGVVDEPSLDDLASDLSSESVETTNDGLDDFGDFDLDDTSAADSNADDSNDDLSLDDSLELDTESAPDELATDELATDELATDELATDELATDELATDDSFSLDLDSSDTDADDALSLDLNDETSVDHASDDDNFSLDDSLADSSSETLTDDDLSAMDSDADEISLDDDFDLGEIDTATGDDQASSEDTSLSLDDTNFDLGDADLPDTDTDTDVSLDLSDDDDTSDDLGLSSAADTANTASAVEPAADLGLDDEDEFAFLGDTDENATKLDLARAYIDMGDSEGAKDILSEVVEEGSEQQQSEAKELLGKLS